MAATKVKIYYNSSDEVSILAAATAYVKYNVPNATLSIVDTNGLDDSGMTALITGTSYTAIVVANGVAASHATGKFTYDKVAAMDAMLATAYKGSVAGLVTSGTCQSNATTTEIKLAATASADNDTYNDMYISTAGVTAIYRQITNYVGSTTTCTVVSTGTAVTTTETYKVYTLDNVHLVGNASSNLTAASVAWADLFPGVTNPLIVNLLGGYSSTQYPYAFYNTTADSVGTATLTDTSAFTANAYNGGNFWVGIESGTLGVGERHRILSNTANVLTLAEDWHVDPTGTIKYMITPNPELLLAYNYLPYSIKTYLWDLNFPETQVIWKQLLDKYDFVNTKTTFTDIGQDLTLLQTYIDKGRCIFDAKAKSVVS